MSSDRQRPKYYELLEKQAERVHDADLAAGRRPRVRCEWRELAVAAEKLRQYRHAERNGLLALAELLHFTPGTLHADKLPWAWQIAAAFVVATVPRPGWPEWLGEMGRRRYSFERTMAGALHEILARSFDDATTGRDWYVTNFSPRLLEAPKGGGPGAP